MIKGFACQQANHDNKTRLPGIQRCVRNGALLAITSRDAAIQSQHCCKRQQGKQHGQCTKGELPAHLPAGQSSSRHDTRRSVLPEPALAAPGIAVILPLSSVSKTVVRPSIQMVFEPPVMPC